MVLHSSLYVLGPTREEIKLLCNHITRIHQQIYSGHGGSSGPDSVEILADLDAMADIAEYRDKNDVMVISSWLLSECINWYEAHSASDWPITVFLLHNGKETVPINPHGMFSGVIELNQPTLLAKAVICPRVIEFVEPLVNFLSDAARDAIYHLLTPTTQDELHTAISAAVDMGYPDSGQPLDLICESIGGNPDERSAHLRDCAICREAYAEQAAANNWPLTPANQTDFFAIL